jgi:surfactin synthase thioesterase subunit
MLSANVGAWRPDRPERGVVRLRVLCFPHAGGGASAFRGWTRDQPPGVDIRAVQLPGREDRIREPFPEDILALCEALLPSLDVPYVLVGNSLGALVAFELARQFQQRYFLPPIRLVAVGARPPGTEYQPPPGAPLACPVTAVFGADDTDMSCSDLVGWSAFTVGGLHCMEVPGDHFALLGCRDQVLGPIYAEAALVQSAGPRSQIGPDPVRVTEPTALTC